MDKLDKLNNTVIDLALNWKNIFYFVAGIYVLATILGLGWGAKFTFNLVISWLILILVGVLMELFILKEKKTPSKEAQDT